jgi:large subunit ribosomal protein L3
MNALIGTKVGMTQVFDDEGRMIPVTVLEVGPCAVVQRKTTETDGYDAVQLGFADQKPSRVTKPLRGHFKRGGAEPKRHLQEVRVDAGSEAKEGETADVSLFGEVGFVDVIGVSKGRGFQGVVKRHGMGGGRASHGGGNLRGGGSIGMCEFPARVFKGKKMPGQMGNKRTTVQNLKVVEVRGEDNALLVRGAVPGPNGGLVLIRESRKKPGAPS